MRPTGKLHLGNYVGALKNWVRLQEEYECFFFVADVHALTTDYADPKRIKKFVPEMAIDWLAAGLDPETCTIFVQSRVLQHAELHVLLSMMTPLSWLERVPTYKDQIENLKEKDLDTYGFLGYPLLQSADILLYGARGASLHVPVGADQVAHVEMTREVARRFEHLRGIWERSERAAASEDSEELDYQPGDPDRCPVGDLHKVFSSAQTLAEVYAGCTTAGIGCIECKGWLADAVVRELAPMQERRAYYEAHPQKVEEILMDGNERAAAAAEETMGLVRLAMGLRQA